MADCLLDIHHKLDLVKDLVEVAFKAGDALEPMQRDPLRTLLDITSSRLKEAIDDLEEFRKHHRSETTNV